MPAFVGVALLVAAGGAGGGSFGAEPAKGDGGSAEPCAERL